MLNNKTTGQARRTAQLVNLLLDTINGTAAIPCDGAHNSPGGLRSLDFLNYSFRIGKGNSGRRIWLIRGGWHGLLRVWFCE
ncbi:hypothetical protein F3Y22_tig00110339pilonHSYRG00170 [Hibiscus syriacus]|uniref:Uncharacterized protein n=1 Tax=Hibiscus syriacus TaxID=106335 RepID=A0A6A3AZT2_HIBSY|nr:hypothetical protein F3Y22_tig00110339pilonHSYRG00170 [Hibiscus syriacus]